MDNQSEERDTALSDDDEQLADRQPEGPPRQDPSGEAVGNLPFYKFFCLRVQKLWRNKREKVASKRWKEKDRLEYILPRRMIKDLNGQTIFPYLRLLLPEQDSRRQFNVKEKKIAEAYCKVLAFRKGTKSYEMLMVCTEGA